MRVEQDNQNVHCAWRPMSDYTQLSHAVILAIAAAVQTAAIHAQNAEVQSGFVNLCFYNKCTSDLILMHPSDLKMHTSDLKKKKENASE